VPLILIFSLLHCYSSVRLWALSGELLMEMVGHTSIVYSVDSHVSGLVVSGSEDCSAKIWKGDFIWFSCFFLDKLSVILTRDSCSCRNFN
jgi:WD40 repeat protein